MASEPKHREIENQTQPVSSENEETIASEDEKSLSEEATSTECKFDYCIVIEYCYGDCY